MRTSSALALIFILAGLASCDPGYYLVVRNTSGKDVKMRVVYDQPDTYWRRRFLDTNETWAVRSSDESRPVYSSAKYITFYDSSNRRSLREVRRAIVRRSVFDSVCSCIMLILPAGEKVILEGGIGVSPNSQEIIFNDADTVAVPFSKRVRKKPRIWPGGAYIVSSSN